MCFDLSLQKKTLQPVPPLGKARATASWRLSTRPSTRCRSWPPTRRPPCTRSPSTTRWPSSAALPTALACGTTPSRRCSQKKRRRHVVVWINLWHYALLRLCVYAFTSSTCSPLRKLVLNNSTLYMMFHLFVLVARASVGAYLLDFRQQQQAPPGEATEGRVGPREGAHGPHQPMLAVHHHGGEKNQLVLSSSVYEFVLERATVE